MYKFDIHSRICQYICCFSFYYSWLLACAKSGRKEQVETFLIDSISDDNVNLSSLLNKQSADKQLNQSENLLTDNQSTKHIQIDQSESSKIRKNDLLNENGANLNKTNESIAQNYANEPEHDLPSPSKQQEVVRSNETSLPDFSTMGDTAAILAGLDSQREQDCDKSRTRNIPGDETVSTANNESSQARLMADETTIGAKNNVPSHTRDISEEINTFGAKHMVPSCLRDTAESNVPSRTRDTVESNVPSRSRDTVENNVPSHMLDASNDVNDVITIDNEDGVLDVHGEKNTNVPVINKNLLGARNDTKKPETPPLTRCTYSL